MGISKGFTCDHWRKECRYVENCSLKNFGEVITDARSLDLWMSKKWVCCKDCKTLVRVTPIFLYLMRRACVLESKKYVRENRRKKKTLEMVE